MSPILEYIYIYMIHNKTIHLIIVACYEIIGIIELNECLKIMSIPQGLACK